jgi:hypothetical protein
MPALICLLIGSAIFILVGPKEALISVAAFYGLFSLFSFWIFSRTGNLSFLAGSLWQFLFGLFLLTRPKIPIFLSVDYRISGLVLIMMLVSALWLIYTVIKKMAKWKGREVFELASVSIEAQADGFTERPRPAGRTEYTKDELMGFAEFLNRNLVAMPYKDENRIVFVPVKMGDEYSYLFNPEKFRGQRSWIAFDFEGEVTVNISRMDYLDYREELSFDQLCDNLGKLFIRFMEYYRKGEGDRIIYQLNELGLGLTS